MAHTWYPLSIHFDSIRIRKMTKFKMRKSDGSMELWKAEYYASSLFHEKAGNNKMSCAPSKGSDPPSLIRVFAVHLKTQTFFRRTAKTYPIGQMPRLIWVLLGTHVILLVLLCCSKKKTKIEPGHEKMFLMSSTQSDQHLCCLLPR